MMGREAGTAGHVKSTDYIVSEVKRLGLEPAGDSGGYLPAVPMIPRALDPVSMNTAPGGTPRARGVFIAPTPRVVPAIDRAQGAFGRLALGTWQSVTLVDTNRDNPRRQVRLSFLG